MQLYAARPVNGGWESKQLTEWDKAIEFSGGGSMKSIGVNIRQFEKLGDKAIVLRWSHKDYGSGMMQLDDLNLEPLKELLPVVDPVPSSLKRVKSPFPEMAVRAARTIGDSPEAGVYYRLQWESLGANNDKPRTGKLPEPSELWLHKIRLTQP